MTFVAMASLGGWLAGSAVAGGLDRDFGVAFDGCTEYAGIGFVPYANAASWVPSGWTLAGDGVNAIVVVRVADCESVSVDGGRARPGTLSQIGLTVVGPDGDADIDNYTLWYSTDHLGLQLRLLLAGLDATWACIDYDFDDDGTGSGPLDIGVSPLPWRAPDHELHGTAFTPVSTPTTFVARWWQEGPHGTVLMRTEFPDIQFSGAEVTLTTSADSDLAALIGDTTLTFSLLDSYNAVTNADMDVTVD